MFIEVMFLSLLLVKLRDRDIKKLGRVYINGWYLILIGFIIQILSFFYVSISKDTSSLNEFYGIINLVTYILIIIILLVNRKYKGFKFMVIGNIFNLIPMVFNYGKMPVYEKALNFPGLESQKELLASGQVLTHTIFKVKDGLFLFSDIIPIPKPYIIPKVISIGDILISIGIIIFVLSYTKRNE